MSSQARRKFPLIGDQLRAILEARAMTQLEFARLIGASESQVNRWIKDRHAPTTAKRRQIAEILDVDPADLLPRDDDAEKVAA